MFQLLNRITWIVSIILGIAIFSIHDDLFIFALVAVFAIKFLVFSPNYIRERLHFFKTQLLKGYHPEKGEKVESISVSSFDQIEPEETMPVQENLAFAEIDTNVKTETTEVYEQSVDTIQTKESSKPNMIQRFFAENLLAKLGGILVFLGVLFFLSLIYAVIGPVAKMAIGFLISGAVYLGGIWLDKKGYTNESRIVMGTSILINYLVILSGRYILGDDGILSVGVMFFFLILNTVFAVMTSLIYESRTLLIFSFVFAYLNPFLLGEPASEPYTLLGYTMIVTLGAMYLSWKQKDEILFPLSFIFASIMFILAPWTDANGWIAKLLCINILGVIGLSCIPVFEKKYEKIFEFLVAGIFFLIGFMGLLGISRNLSEFQYILLGVSSLTLMTFAYIQSRRGVYLYSLGSVGFILTLSPVILSFGNSSTSMSLISFCLILTFMILNITYILWNLKNTSQTNVVSILSGLISGALFLTYMIYFFGNTYFPGMLQGFVFLALACIYSFLAYMTIQIIGIEKVRSEQKYMNLFYSVSALALSIFSLAIAFVFANTPEIILIIWILEASVLFFLAQKIGSHKTALGALILLSIGIGKIFLFFLVATIGLAFPWLVSYQVPGNHSLIISLVIVLAAFIANLVFLFPQRKQNTLDSWVHAVHHILHLIGLSIIYLLGVMIFKLEDTWYALVSSIVYITIFWNIYSYLGAKTLMLIAKTVSLLFTVLHILIFLDDTSISYKKYILSTISLVVLSIPYIWEYIQKKSVSFTPYFIGFLLYAFVLSSLYIYDITNLTFAVTLYWGVLAFLVFSRGISGDILPLRTIGLYLITLTCGKVFFFDVWYSVDNVISRVVVLMVVGILMIILSTMYTKKFGNTLGKDFSPENLFPKGNPDSNKRNDKKVETQIEKSKIQTDIEAIDVSSLKSVSLHVNGSEKAINMRVTNVLKIAKLITNTYKKTSFHSGELEKAYSMIEKDFKSELSPAQHTKLKSVIADFVEKGGNIELIKK